MLIALLIVLTASGAIFPEASGDKVDTDGGLRIDSSNASDGYVMVKIDGDGKKYKLRAFYGDDQSTYDVKVGDDYIAIPLNYGSGEYTFTLFKNVKGNKYSDDGSIRINATLDNELGAFLCPSQYVDYTADSPCVAEADSLCAGLDSDKDKFAAIKDYIIGNFMYDFIKAVSVKGGALPDIDGCWASRSGICQDLSAIACAMLRSQGVPCKLMIGYANDQYHAWCSVFIGGEEQMFDPTLELGSIGKGATYTVERYY